MRLLSKLSLSTKAVVLGLAAGLGLWLALHNYQESQLSTLLDAELATQLQRETERTHGRFFAAVERHGRLSNIFAAYEPLAHYLRDYPDKVDTSAMPADRTIPPWVPPVNAWRGLIFPSAFLLYNNDGELLDHWAFTPQTTLLQPLVDDPAHWLRRSNRRALVSEIKATPIILASAPVSHNLHGHLGYIAFYSLVDDHFMRATLTQELAADTAAVLLTGGYGEQRVWASSDPVAVPRQTTAAQLAQSYLFSGDAFFDQGDWDLQGQLAVLLPKTALAQLNKGMLALQRKQRLLAAIAYITVFSGLMIYLSFRLQRVVRQVERFAEHELQAPLPPSTSVDLVSRLSESLSSLTREVNSSREAKRLQSEMQRRADQLKTLQSATDALRVGVLRNEHGAWRAVNDAMTRFVVEIGDSEQFTQCHDAELDIYDLDGQRRVFKLARLGNEQQAEPPLLLVNEVTDLTIKTEALTRLALYDPLTGIPNRVLLGDRLTQAIARTDRSGIGFALLLLDLNRFKEVNDTLGHSAGDRLLAEVAYRFNQHMRAIDTFSRMGGDEFAIILCASSEDRAKMIAARLLEAQRQPYQIDDQLVDVGVSIGIVLYPEHGDSNESLLAHADIAMYQAKRQHLGQFVYDPTIDTSSRQNLSLLSELRQAIAHKELRLLYQPQLDLRSLEITSWEALVRWQHPRRGLLAPSQFIPQAEDSGIIGDLTRFVLQHAIADCRAWRDLGISGGVSVNLSTRDCTDPALPRRVEAALKESRLEASALTLEITETALMHDPANAGQMLETLDQAGVGISVDDFGTGYSSLAYLKHLPIDEIKIDRAFVHNMLTNSADTAIVQAVIGLAHNLGLRVVAEGVEDRSCLTQLVERDCDVAQGYWLARPVALADIGGASQQARLAVEQQKAPSGSATSSP